MYSDMIIQNPWNLHIEDITLYNAILCGVRIDMTEESNLSKILISIGKMYPSLTNACDM